MDLNVLLKKNQMTSSSYKMNDDDDSAHIIRITFNSVKQIKSSYLLWIDEATQICVYTSSVCKCWFKCKLYMCACVCVCRWQHFIIFILSSFFIHLPLHTNIPWHNYTKVILYTQTHIQLRQEQQLRRRRRKKTRTHGKYVKDTEIVNAINHPS